MSQKHKKSPAKAGDFKSIFHGDGAEHHALSGITVFVANGEIAVYQSCGALVKCFQIAVAAGRFGKYVTDVGLWTTGGGHDLNAVFPFVAGRVVRCTDEESGASVTTQRHTTVKGQQCGPNTAIVKIFRICPRFATVIGVNDIARSGESGLFNSGIQTASADDPQEAAVRRKTNVILSEAFVALFSFVLGEEGEIVHQIPSLAVVF